MNDNSPGENRPERSAGKPTLRENTPLILGIFVCFAALFGLNL